MVLMRECWPANRSTDGRSHMVYTRSPGERWLRKRRWEESCRGGWRRTTTFPGCIVDFLRCGLWSPGGIKLERPVTLNLRCQKERTVGLLPPQGWPGRSMLVPEPCRALGLPWVQPVQLRELTCSENSHLEQT